MKRLTLILSILLLLICLLVPGCGDESDCDDCQTELENANAQVQDLIKDIDNFMADFLSIKKQMQAEHNAESNRIKEELVKTNTALDKCYGDLYSTRQELTKTKTQLTSTQRLLDECISDRDKEYKRGYDAGYSKGYINGQNGNGKRTTVVVKGDCECNTMCYSYKYDEYISCNTARAICNDGTCSTSTGAGTCSWHGGVKCLLN